MGDAVRFWKWLMGEDAVMPEKHAVMPSSDAVDYADAVARAVKELNGAVKVAVVPHHAVEHAVESPDAQIDAVAEPPTEMVGQIGRHMAFQAVERVKIFSIGPRTVEVHTEFCEEAQDRASSMGARVELASMEELEDGGFLVYDHACRRSNGA